MKELQICPICKNNVRPNERYQNYLCIDCTAKLTDKEGRKVSFANEGFFGGCIGSYEDGAIYVSHSCYVDGIECEANEAKFGGIVIQTIDR